MKRTELKRVVTEELLDQAYITEDYLHLASNDLDRAISGLSREAVSDTERIHIADSESDIDKVEDITHIVKVKKLDDLDLYSGEVYLVFYY